MTYHDPDCEMCTESFDDDELTQTFYWTVLRRMQKHRGIR